MGESRNDKDFLGFLKTLGDIGGYVAAVVAYLLALTGRSLTPYPNTISFFTALVTVAAVWMWRWPRVTEKLVSKNSTAKTKKGKNGSPEKKDIFDPIRAQSKQPYKRTLTQRRFEVFVLFGLFVAVLILGGFKVPYMQEEVTGLNCLNASGNFRVMITNFTFSPEQDFENDLGNALVRQAQESQICRYQQEVEFIDDVYLLKDKYDADLVIWGNYSDDRYEIEFTSTPEFVYSKADGLPVQDTEEQMAFLTAKTTATIYFVQGDAAAAREQLLIALDAAESQGWVDENPALLADGYFLMGLILSAGPVDAPSALDPAINAYSRAIKLDLEFEPAIWNRSLLYLDQGRWEDALASYDALIQLDGSYAVDARWMKAQLFLDDGDCKTAIQGMEETLKLPGVDETHDSFTDLIYVLGKAHLLCRDYPAAEDAFEQMPPLTADFAPVYIEDLNILSAESDDPLLQKEVQKIINMLQQNISH
jgi:tetratricopeptide (TPR) repeat protein